MKAKHVSYNQILDIYREQNAKFGGFCAIRDNNALLSVIANPQRQFAGRDLYPTLAQKVAILVYSMIKNHPFVDGNKRMAFISGRILLRLNGYDIASREDYYSIIMKIAKDEASKEDVFEWFELSIIAVGQIKAKQEERRK